MFNFNVGILGHVDSGKTTIAKALSNIASTAAFDKNPQSQARGITLDLGFSSFYVATPQHLKDELPEINNIQLTLVDCPGHASLIRTVIGGAQIIDLVLLVVDVTKGIQTQTAECLVIAEITCKKLIVVLNKIDLLEDKKRLQVVEKMKKKLNLILPTIGFPIAPIISISANPGENQQPLGLKNLITQISKSIFIPVRNKTNPLLLAVDHCFAVKGKGTVLTGTVLQGTIKTDDVIDLPMLSLKKKVKSMQMFKQPVQIASAGDRLGVCVTQFDPKLMERGVVCTPGYLNFIYCGILSVTKIKHFKSEVLNKSKYHISVGHQTAMAAITIFGNTKENNELNFDWEYECKERLSDDRKEFLLLEFEKPVLAVENSLLIGSKLDMDVHGSECRLAFWGNLSVVCTDKNYKDSFLPKLKLCKNKNKTGTVDRVSDKNNVIIKNMFKKETNLETFMGLQVKFSTGETGVIQSAFGKSGKIVVYIVDGLQDTTLKVLEMKSQQVIVNLDFKRYIHDPNKKVLQ